MFYHLIALATNLFISPIGGGDLTQSIEGEEVRDEE